MKRKFLFIATLIVLYSNQLIIAQGIIKDDFLVNDDAGNEFQMYTSISMDGVGNFVIVWQDFRNSNWDIYYQRYTSTGTPLGVNTKVNDDSVNASQEHPSIAMDITGNFVIVWDDYRNNNHDIYFQRYTGTGTALGNNTKVNDDIDSVKQWSPSISMDGAGNFVIVWIDERNLNSDIYYQRYWSTGAAIGVNKIVNDDSTTAHQGSPSISMDIEGNFVIAWDDFRSANFDIYYQRYWSTGAALGVNTKVNDDAGNEFQVYPSISMDGAANFIIVWQDLRNINWDIYYQRYTSIGTTLGVNTKVNDDAGSAYQKIPSISINGVGDFVIVWMDYRYGQTNTDIFGQRYFSSGYPNGVNYRIVADGPNDGEATPVVYANNSDIIFSWEDNRRSAGWDIYAKIVSWNWNGVTSLIDEGNINPKDFSLSQNYPNPFNPKTVIGYQLPESGNITLKVFDILGREVATLVDEYKPAGSYEVEFSSHSDEGQNLSSGVYFYQLKVRDPETSSGQGIIQTKKMILLK